MLANFNGTQYKSTAKYSHIVLNDAGTESAIPINQAYEGYATEELKPAGSDGSKIEDAPLLGMMASQFHYKTFDDKDIYLASVKGKYILLDFWESWCGQCIVAIPKLKKLNEAYHAKGLVLMGITTENADIIKRLIAVNGVSYLTLKADRQILNDYKVSGRPTYVLIAPGGKIVAHSEGNLDVITKILDDKLK